MLGPVPHWPIGFRDLGSAGLLLQRPERLRDGSSVVDRPPNWMICALRPGPGRLVRGGAQIAARTRRCRCGRPYGDGRIHVGPGRLVPESHRLGRYAMTTIPSTAVVVYDPGRLDPEHVALAGFLGGYRGLTRDAYALDLRGHWARSWRDRDSGAPNQTEPLTSRPRSRSNCPSVGRNLCGHPLRSPVRRRITARAYVPLHDR